jgi:hypothetical protein
LGIKSWTSCHGLTSKEELSISRNSVPLELGCREESRIDSRGPDHVLHRNGVHFVVFLIELLSLLGEENWLLCVDVPGWEQDFMGKRVFNLKIFLDPVLDWRLEVGGAIAGVEQEID